MEQQVIEAIKQEAVRLGSNAAVARKVNVSEATISQILSGTYQSKGTDIYNRIANALSVDILQANTSWNIVETRNYKMMTAVLNDARMMGQFKAVSEKAGSGKTTATRLYASQYSNAVFYLQCREWSRTKFMTQLMRLLGLNPNVDYDGCIEQIADFFKKKHAQKPLLIIDEADKIKPAAIRALIPLYNECEGKLGVVICGTDNLEKEFKRGVKLYQKGYDELMSRFGRAFIHLVGEDRRSVLEICQANGINDANVADKIFKSCDTQSVSVGNIFQTVIKDLRQVRSKIEGYKMQKPMGAVS